jgi:hypothetical protein
MSYREVWTSLNGCLKISSPFLNERCEDTAIPLQAGGQAEKRGFSIYQFFKSYFVFPVSNPCLDKPENRGKVFCASLNVGEPD